MQSRMGMLHASPRPVGRAARCVYMVLLIALWFGCAPSALAKDMPQTVLEVTPATGSTFGDKLTVYGIVSSPTPTGPAPTGTITFAFRDPPPTNYNHTVCSVTIDTDYPVQSCESPVGFYVPAGTRHFILIYSGDVNYEGNDNGMLASEDYLVSKQTPTIALSPPAPVFVGQYASLQLLIGNATQTEGQFGATIGGGNGDCNILGGGQICAAGKTRFAGTAIPVYAGFVGDNNHNAVPNTEVGQITILPAPTTLVIKPHVPIALGDTAIIDLAVSTIFDPDATFYGNITLSDGEVSCQFDIVNPIDAHTNVECPLKPLTPGTRQLTAAYSGSNNATPSTATGTLEVVAAKVDGACGSDNGGVLAAAPTNLCSAGTPSAVGGTGHPWSWTCAGISGGSDASCSATIRTWTVSAQASGSGGSITPPSQAVDNGNAAMLTVSADADYVIAGVTGCGGSLAGNTYTTAPVSADCTVTATFAAVASTTYTVTAVASPAGTGSLTCASPVNAGATSTCAATPHAGYVTQSISGCGGTATTSGVNSYTTGAVNANCTVTARFAAVASPQASVPAPALDKWALAVLGLLLAAAAGVIARRKEQIKGVGLD